MIDIVKQFFNKATTQVTETSNQNTEHDIRVATCALFVEMARIDETFTEAEMNTILEYHSIDSKRKVRLILGTCRCADRRS
jgi:uncharacterized tellurite resistance protein B-like protein